MLLIMNTDTDECALGTFECGERYVCNNTEGSYECVCRLGYQLSADKESCEGNFQNCLLGYYRSVSLLSFYLGFLILSLYLIVHLYPSRLVKLLSAGCVVAC